MQISDDFLKIVSNNPRSYGAGDYWLRSYEYGEMKPTKLNQTVKVEPSYETSTGEGSNLWQQLVQINTRDAMNIGLLSRLEELRSTEAEWVPQIQEALEYLRNQKSILELDPNDPDYQQKKDSISSLVNEERALMRGYAVSNPYLRDIFYNDAVDRSQEIPGVRPARTISKNRIHQMLQRDPQTYKGQLAQLSFDQSVPNVLLGDDTNANYLNKLDTLIKLTQDKLEDAEVERFIKRSDIESRQRALKTAHRVKDPIIGLIPLYQYDPSLIDPEFDQKRNEVDIELTDPSSWKYGLAHLGSSASELKAMGLQMLTGFAISKLATRIAGSYAGPAAPLAWAAGDATLNTLFTNWMRHKETASEVMSSYSQKIMNAAVNNQFDINKVLSEYKEQLELLAVPVQNMDELEILQTGLAYNIITSDENYNKIAKDARRGLTDLEQGNNALAMSDYAQNFGLSYGGKLIKNSFGFSSLLKKGAKLLSKNDNTRRALQAITSKIDRSIDNMRLNPITKVQAKRVMNTAFDIAKQTGKNWFLESSEEGMQAGMTDEYLSIPSLGNEQEINNWLANNPVPVATQEGTGQYNFLKGLLNDGKLGVEAWKTYMGSDSKDAYNTDNELVRSMQIGGFIGALMGTGFHAIPQLNELRKQLKTDNRLRALAAEGFDNADRTFKIAQFLDAYRKGSKTDRIVDTVEQMKQYKTGGVTDQMIDEDIDLVRQVGQIYKNEAIRQNLKDLGVDKKKGDWFNYFTTAAIDYTNRRKQVDEELKDSNEELDKIVQAIITNNQGELEELLRSQYDLYQQQQTAANQQAIEYETFRLPAINAAIIRARRRVLDQLEKEITSRRKTLQEITKQFGIKTSVSGLDGILGYIKDTRRELKKTEEEINHKMFSGKLQKLPEFDNTEELENALAKQIINQAIQSNLLVVENAYRTGRIPTKLRYLVEQEQLFSSLTPEQQANVLTEYAEKWKTEHSTQEEPTRKQIISYYNTLQKQQWGKLEQSSNIEANERFLANNLFQQDVRRLAEERTSSAREIEEQTGEYSLNRGETTTEPIIPEDEITTTATSTVTASEPSDRTGNDNADTSAEKSITATPVNPRNDRTKVRTAVDEVETQEEDISTDVVQDDIQDSQISEEQADALVQEMLDDVSENGYREVTNEELGITESDDKADIERTTNKVDESIEEEIDIRAKIEGIEYGQPLVDDQQIIDETNTEDDLQEVQQDNGSEETVLNTTPQTTPIKDQSEQKEITVNTESTEDPDIIEEVPVILEDPEEIVYSNGEEVWVGNEDINQSRIIPENDIQTQLDLEEADSVDMAGTSSFNNRHSDKVPGLDTNRKIETNRIKNTLFYSFDSDEVMPINVNGKPMNFGNVERRPGRELAKKLAIPGWLKQAKAYFVVTDSRDSHKDRDLLAIHLIIEDQEDGKTVMYNAALYTPDKAMQKMRRWNLPGTKIGVELARLRKLRNSIIDQYVKAYAPDYFSNTGAKLPQTAQKGLIPINLRQSNGAINSLEDEHGRPIFRSLTDIPGFKLSSDPYEMTEQILSNQVEIGYGRGPFTMNPADAFSIMQFDGVTRTSQQGVGFAGKLFIIPDLDQAPSGNNSAPIMLSEKKHTIQGGIGSTGLSFDLNGTPRYDDNGKRIPVTSAELIFRLITNTVPFATTPIFQDILDILVNRGPKTITIGDPVRENLNMYNRKVLHTYQNANGETFLMYGAVDSNGNYRTKNLKIRDANGKIAFTESQALYVINQFSRNLHWNTSIEGMTQPISENIVKEAIRYMEQNNTDTFKILGMDDLTFTMKDLGLERRDDKIVRVGEQAPALISWMINHQVLKANIGDTLFRDPFIYADDAVLSNEQRAKVESTTTEVTKDTPTEEEKSAENKVQEIPSTPTTQIPKGDKALTIQETRDMGLTPKRGFTYVLKEDGTTVLLPNSSSVLRKLQGLHSTNRGVGRIDLQQARQWLVDTLGIDPTDVLFTNAVMKMADSDSVYGVMRVVLDRIANEFRPNIILSQQAGKGVEYHEAFHYVSMLLLDEVTRDRVYDDFVKKHPEYKESTKTEVEEALAEEFRYYMLDRKEHGLSYRIKKFFRTIVELLLRLAGRNLNGQVYSALFDSIRKGNFKNAKVSQEAMREFEQAYQSGLHYYAPGIPEDEQKKVPHITNASMMYNIIESLSSTALATLQIQTMDDIRNLKLDDVFNTIQYMLDNGEYDYSPTRKQVAQDVLLNKDLFATKIRSFLQELGVRTLEDTEEEMRTNDNYENIWDKASYEISKKDNVAFNAKLFFYSIPQSRFILDEDGNKQLVTVKDDIFGLDVAQSFDVTWNKILENLWNVNNWDDLIARVRDLAKADPFFAKLREYIDDPDFPLPENTVTQLITTIQSAKNSMDTVFVNQTNNLWSVQDSSNLRYIARLPQRWSDNFMLSSLVTVDERGRGLINNKALNQLNMMSSKIDRTLAEISKAKTTKDKVKKFQQAKNEFLNLLNFIGIPFDEESLQFLLDKVQAGASEIDGLSAFNKIWSSDNKHGSIRNSIKLNVLANIRKIAASKSLSTRYVSADRIFNYKDQNSVINLMAVAYGTVHPTPEEFSVTGADGSLVYPITQNNYMSDMVRWLNTNAYNKRDNLLKSPYNATSLILQTLQNGGKIKLHTLLAVEEQQSRVSRDYFGISPLEDYLTKMVLAENGRLILPTMSDKKTWYSVEGVTLPKDHLNSLDIYADFESGETDIVSMPRRFSDQTLNIFYNYFVAEFNAIVNYYNTKSDVENSKSNYYDNYHGKIGSDGKMKPGGNGGKFRYFGKLPVNGSWVSLNKLLTQAEESGDPKVIQNVLDNIKRMYVDDPNMMRNILNDLLITRVNEEIEEAIKLGVIARDRTTGRLINKCIPSGATVNLNGEEINNPFSHYNEVDSVAEEGMEDIKEEDRLYSIIANYTTAYAISVIEVEKCFVGDPAMYKWKSNDSVGIFQKDVDKIKRLSSVLSTGTNLRTHWGQGDPRNDTRFVSMVMQDNQIGSDYHEQLVEIFKASYVRTILTRKNPNMTDDEKFELTRPGKLQDTYNSLTDSEKRFVDSQAENAANPYAYNDKKNSGNINQADAAVYIRPEMYKRIMQALGEWSPEIEEAYNILENSDKVLSDPELYAKSLKATIRPLKMMYFGEHFDEVSKANIPVFDKMALFPMFKVIARGDNRLLYDRMNNSELGEIDMIAFESAVKVGAPANKFRPYKDNRNTKFNIEDLNQVSSTRIKDGKVVSSSNGLTTRIQDLKQLRLQLNTEGHEDTDRSFGTQVIKIGMGNVVDDRHYGHNKKMNVSGSRIKKDIFGCIKALSKHGMDKVQNRFFDKNGRIKNKALSDYLMREAINTNMPSELIDGLRVDKNGNFIAPLASMSQRNWIESKIMSYLGKEIIDVNTPGGAAIQMAPFGFKRTSIVSYKDADLFNNGRKLSFEPRRGSMEVLLSTKFFRDVIPSEFQTDYHTMRNWLLEHKIIGKDAQPYGIGYRIPTQGLSSTFSFIVADVLPEQLEDTIVVPDEFTAMTGSDYDIDKLYIATYSYDPETHERYKWDETKKDNYAQQSDGALINKLLDSYTLVISDEKTLSETRASIDTLTGILKGDVLPRVYSTPMKEAESMYELVPSFQIARKMEYTLGKAGIATFALNSTNHCLTQATHLHMNYSNDNKYGLGQLDQIDGKDGYKILDWLSAMINAHVDVAKDPYIINLNVNQVTWNMVNLLLRGGMGQDTFFFLAQPAIREFADSRIANNGIIGARKERENTTIRRIRNKYIRMLNQLPLSDQQKEQILASVEDDYQNAFDRRKLSDSLEDYKNGDTINVNFIKQQLIVLQAYQDLMSDAQTLGNLVQRSQIDTKKYGNTLTQLQNFLNSYMTFFMDSSEKFDGLQRYFEDTFLQQKLDAILTASNRLMANQLFSATSGYKSIFTNIMQHVRGGKYDPVKRGNWMLYPYNATNDKKFVKTINDRIESIIRARVMTQIPQLYVSDTELKEMLSGKNSMARRLNNIKNYIRQNSNDPTLINLVRSNGTIKNALLNYLQGFTNSSKGIDRIVPVRSSMNNSRYMDDRLTSAFYDLLDSDNTEVRQFAKDLVKYAFVTSYDNRTPNSFFNYVPLAYKQKIGYIDIIQDTIRDLANKDLGILGDTSDIQQMFNSTYTTLVRNYCADDSIVRTYVPNVKDYGDRQQSNTIYLGGATNVGGIYDQAVFITRDKYNYTDKFLKIYNAASKRITLYERLGEIRTVDNDSKFGIVYVAIPKLGYQSGSSSVYELYKSGLEQSAIDSNNFSEAMIEATNKENAIQKVNDYLKHNNNLTFVEDPEFQAVEVALNPDKTESIGSENIEESPITISQLEETPQETIIDMSADETIVDMSGDLMSEGDAIVIEDFGSITFDDTIFDSSPIIEDVMSIIDETGQGNIEVSEDISSLDKAGKKRRNECK